MDEATEADVAGVGGGDDALRLLGGPHDVAATGGHGTCQCGATRCFNRSRFAAVSIPFRLAIAAPFSRTSPHLSAIFRKENTAAVGGSHNGFGGDWRKWLNL